MNRHHPYGGSFEGPSGRRGGSPSGPGPDRHRYHDKGGPSHRGGRGGFGRGRGGGGGGGGGGGYNNYDGPMGPTDAYDQGYSQGNDGYYNGYDASQQAPYYQNSYGGGPDPYGPPPGAPYNQDYGRFEDGPGPGYDNSFEDGYGRGGGGGGGGNGGGHKKGFRRDRGDTKVVDESVIEERIQREKPCRTLFIRNIKYETDSSVVRRQFEEHGDIKTFFDLISTRGMVFVTYFDLRAAERARDRLQGSEIGGRPIDVHYSLPRDDARGDKNQQLQGTVQLTLRNSPSGQPLDDNEIRRKFQPIGDLKSIRPANDRPDSRYIEFYDMRAAEEASERLRHQPIQDGIMDIVLAWDPNDSSQSQGGGGRDHGRGGGDWGDDSYRGGGGRGRGRGGKGGYGRGRGGHHGGGGGGGGGGGYDDRRGPVDEGYNGRFERGGPRGRGGRFEEDGYGGGGGRGGRGGGYGGDRFDSRGGPGGYGPPPPDMGGYGPPPGAYPPGPPPPMPPQAGGPPAPDDRLDQARKVQQLLAALKQPGGGGPPGPTPPGPPGAPGMPPPGSGMGGIPPGPPNATPAGPYYGQPPMPPNGMAYPPGPPPPGPGMYPPPGSAGVPTAPPSAQGSPPQPGASSAPPGLENLPPNLLAMLQAAQRPGAPANGYPAANGQPSNAQYQALMGYLQQQQQAGAKQ